MNAVTPIEPDREVLSGEVIPPGMIRVVVARHAFTTDFTVELVPVGSSFAQIVDRAGLSGGFRAWIDDVEVGVETMPQWAFAKPKGGREVYLRAVAHGGGRGGKNVLGLLLQVAVLAASVFLPPALGIAGTILGVDAAILAGAAINIVGNLAIGLLLPPVPPILPESGGSSETYSLTGGSNTLNRYGPVPSLLGLMRVVPPYAAAPYTELVGFDQYLNVVFEIGYGRIQVSDLRIGDTPIDSYRDVQIEIREGAPDDLPRTLYTNDVDERPLNIKLEGGEDGGWFQQATGIGADEISFDITWPAGLIGITRNGEKFARDVTVYAQYKPIEGDTWYDVPGFPYSLEARVSRVLRGGQRFTPTHVSPTKNYLLQLAKPRPDVDPAEGLGSNLVYWTAIRNIKHVDPIRFPGTATVAVRIKANDQLNGTLDQFNCLAQVICDDYDAGTDTWIERATSNPASLYRRVMVGPGRKTKPADEMVDWDGLADWHVYCDAMGWRCNGYLDQDGTVGQVLDLIAATGRAARAKPNGKHGVVIDREQAVPVQLFTPRNSWGFKGSKDFFERPHALRKRFINADLDYQQDEYTIYADGYDADTATRFQTSETAFCTDPDLIFLHGRFELAQMILRPETFELWADAEVLRCTRGSLVKVAHDVILVGLVCGARVIAITDDGGSPAMVQTITIDNECVFAAGVSYCVAIRTVGHNVVTVAVANPAVTDPVATSTLTLAGALARSWLATPTDTEGGDLLTFGEADRESVECVVTIVTPGDDLSAKLTLMLAAPGVYEADTGPIPAFESLITRPTRQLWVSPPAPVVYSVRSDESVLLRNTDGTLVTRILIQLVPRAPGDEPLSGFQARIKLTSDPTDQWTVLDPFRGDAIELSILDVDDGETYDIELRAISERNRPSTWTRLDPHFVIGKTTPPPPVETAWRNADGTIAWDYPSPPRDFAGFLIRSLAGEAPDSNWAVATPAHANIVTAPPFNVSTIGFGVRTVLIRPVDVAGNVATSSARLVIDFGPVVADQLIDQVDLHPTFPGSIDAGAVVSDELVGAELVNFWEAVPTRPFWSGDPDADFWGTGNYGAISYLWFYTAYELGRLQVDIDIDAPQGWSIEWAPLPSHLFWMGDDGATWWSGDDDAVWWSGEDGTFRAWPGTANVDEGDFMFRLVAVGGAIQPTVTTLSMLLDVPTVGVLRNDVSIPNTGIRIEIQDDLRWVDNVQLTLEDDGGTAVSATWTGKGSSEGPLVYVRNAAGALTTGTVDAYITGARK